jgi:hypothetical protein
MTVIPRALSSAQKEDNIREAGSPWEDRAYNGIVSHSTGCTFQQNSWPLFSRHGFFKNEIKFDKSFSGNSVTVNLLECAELLWSVKCYLLARMRPRARIDSISAPPTVEREWNELRNVLKWMIVERSSRSFSIFNDPDTVEDWISYAKSIAGSRHHLTRLLAPLDGLFKERDRMPLMARVVSHPFNGDSVSRRAKFRPIEDATPVPRIPDEIAIPMLSACFDLVRDHADEAIELIGDYSAAKELIAKQGLSESAARHRARFEIWERGETLIANQKIQPFFAAGREIKSISDIHRLEIELRIACVAIIGCFAGPRLGEMLAFVSGCLTGPTISSDGTLEIFWLNGHIFKNAPGHGQGKAHVWLAGARPVGTTTFVPVVCAIEVLEKLRRALAPKSATLIFSFIDRSPMHAGMVGPAFKSALHKLLETDREQGWNFHSMQFRKTCAHFMAHRHRRGLGLVAELFGHNSYAMALGYAGTDVDLNADFAKIACGEAALELRDIANSGAVTGVTGERIRVALLEFRGMFAAEAQFVQIVADAIKDNLIKIFPAEWGACFYHQRNSQCGGNKDAPNYTLRSPETCMACDNLAVSETHRPYHNWRVQQFQSMLNRYPDAAAFQVVEWTQKRDKSQAYCTRLDQQKGGGN